MKRAIRDDLGALKLVKNRRNRLAHGAVSFTDCADGVTVAELRVRLPAPGVQADRDDIVTGHVVPAPTIAAVDLFCGVGGFTHGLIRGGIQVRADVDVACRFPFEANNSATFIEQDVGGESVGHPGQVPGCWAAASK